MKSTKTLLPLLLPLLISCNRGATSTANPSSTGSGSQLKLVYIPKSTGNAYFDDVDRGFREAAKQLNIDYSTTAPSDSGATSQIPYIKAQIQRGVDIIAITPNSPDALNTVLDEARGRGITVVTVDADLVGNESHRDAAVLPADFNQIGSSLIELMGKLTGYQGDIAILSATADAPNQNAWIAKMKETLAQGKYSKMHLVATVYGDDQAQKSTSECEGLIARYPNLRGIISPTSVGLPASAQVIDRDGVYPKGPHASGPGLQLTGLSDPNQMKKEIADGSVTAFELWQPSNQGYLAAYVAEDIHNKALKPMPGAAVETPRVGVVKFGPKLELIAGPLITFDKSNIGKYNF